VQISGDVGKRGASRGITVNRAGVADRLHKRVPEEAEAGSVPATIVPVKHRWPSSGKRFTGKYVVVVSEPRCFFSGTVGGKKKKGRQKSGITGAAGNPDTQKCTKSRNAMLAKQKTGRENR